MPIGPGNDSYGKGIGVEFGDGEADAVEGDAAFFYHEVGVRWGQFKEKVKAILALWLNIQEGEGGIYVALDDVAFPAACS